MKKIFVLAAGIIIVAAILFYLESYFRKQKLSPIFDYKNTEYVIEGQRVKLINGVAETESSQGSASKIVTRFFGNELKADLNGDGRQDVVFLVTRERGGSGTFFYVLAALNTEQGYLGSSGYFLGDRIAPQSTNISTNSGERNVIVVNYADRKPSEPMTTQPSVGKSAYLKLNPVTMEWSTITADFDGELDNGETNGGVYSSKAFGVSFKYDPAQSGVKETKDAIYVYPNSDFYNRDPLSGQFLKKFSKTPAETLEQAIRREILAAYKTNSCTVEISKNDKSGYELAEISYPGPNNPEELYWENSVLCNPEYAQTNGVRYFLYDSKHPDRFYFLSIGQYGILASPQETWQDTIVIQ